MLNLNSQAGLRKGSVDLSIFYHRKVRCLNFLNLKNYVHINKIESCNVYQSALTIFSQKVLGHLDFWMPRFWIWHQKSVFEGSVHWKIASKRCNTAIEMIFCSSERWGSIFWEFHITEPPRSPLIFSFCIHWTCYKSFFARFSGLILSSGALGLRKGLRTSTPKVEHT